MLKEDYYAILGVEKTATVEEISQAYRAAALKYHPDRNKSPEAVEKFKAAAEAFEVLSNTEKRQQYDNPAASSPFFGGFSPNSPFDIFNTFFGGGFHARHQQGIDVEMVVELTFEEAGLGCVKDINFTTRDRCKDCGGTAVKTWKPCITCGGSGKRVLKQSPFVMQTMCGDCRGHGKVPDQRCSCNSGYSGSHEEKLSVTIPAGAFTGLRMKVSGKGEADERGVRGNLFLVMQVHKHALFKRHECDIMYEALVPYSTMVLGGEIEIPTLNGIANVKIAAGTLDGKKMRLNGLGVPNIANPDFVGDMVVLLKVDIPTQLPPEYEKLIKKLTKWEKEKQT